MTISKRILLVVAALIAVFALAVPTFAQDDTFGLSAEDFALWTGANGASTNFTTLDYSFVSDISADVEGDAIAATLSGNGVITSDGFSLILAGNIDGLGSVNIEFRVAGDSAYIKGIDGTDTWYQISESDFTELQNALGEQLPVDPAALASGDTSELNLSDEAQMEVLGSALALVEALPQYISVTREADVEGEAVFVAEFLLNDFVQDENLATIVAAGMTADGTMTFEEAQAQAEQGIGMAVMMTAGSEMSFTQYVDLATNLISEGDLLISLGGSGMPFAFETTFDITINEYDPDVSVSAPESSTPLTDLTGPLGG